MDYYNHSIEIILNNQEPGGAYIASPTFPSYRFCWFRDGSFTAYAMDLVGQTESASRFHGWAAQNILRRKDLIRAAVQKVSDGKRLEKGDILHTRYRLDGEDELEQDWPNFQLDGFGTWLWALRQHQLWSKSALPDICLEAAGLLSEYLTSLWNLPCYDCWEEFPDKVHPHTLAALYGGLKACSALDGVDRSGTLEAIKTWLLENAVEGDYFVKFPGSYTVDASLLGLALPYDVFPLDDPRVAATVQRIEQTLCRGGGGVHRYPTDTYFGGGEWLLLTAWLGWYEALTGRKDEARARLAWIEAQATPAGEMPEQVPASLVDPNYYQPWVQRWGEPATPLLWSHANYLILRSALL
jgi:GH15 family glucan-1,4-alpha-glucosidase